jgi:hypothetical protein
MLGGNCISPRQIIYGKCFLRLATFQQMLTERQRSYQIAYQFIYQTVKSLLEMVTDFHHCSRTPVSHKKTGSHAICVTTGFVLHEKIRAALPEITLFPKLKRKRLLLSWSASIF